MGRQKDQILRELRGHELLILAESVSEKPINPQAKKGDLTKLIKESLNIDEIERMVRDIKHQRRRMDGADYDRTSAVGAFSSTALLKASIIVVFTTFIFDQMYYWTIRYSPLFYEPYFSAIAIIDMIRLIGLAMMVYWFFSSAFRVGADDHATAALLALAGAILIAAVLTSLSLMLMPRPYYSPYFQ